MAYERNHRDIRDKLILENGGMASNTFMDSERDDFLREHGAYDEHGEISHSGYSEWHKPDPVPEEPVKKEKTLSGDAAYLQSIKDKGLIKPEVPKQEDDSAGGLLNYD
jgi:hypothetical protein